MKTTINKPELESLPFGVVVEKWNLKTSGQIKAQYQNTFNDRERKQASKIYKKFKRWKENGVPAMIQVFPSHFRLMQRLCEFFQSI